MNSGFLTCTKCNAVLPDEVFNRPELTRCSGCNVPIRMEVFPAFFNGTIVGQTDERIVAEGESSCFFHPQKKAVVPCEACGRFLCALCDCELNSQHLCPVCLESGKKKGRIKSLQNHRTLHDNVALALAILPLLVFYITIVTAPMALYLAIRHWNTPTSIIPRTRIRFIIAIALASLQILGWIAGIYFLATRL